MVKGQGGHFEPAKESHFKAYYGDRQAVFPDRGAKEIGEGLRKKILKDLGLND